MARYLVTGGAGFIGTNFIRHVFDVRQDWHIVNLDALTYAGNPANMEDLEQQDRAQRYRFAHGDIRDASLLDRLFSEERFDGVIHFAAESHVDRSIFGPDAFVETNVVGTFRLLEASRKFWEEEGKPGKPVVGLLVQSTMSGALFALGFVQPCDGYEVPYAEVKGVEVITEKFAVDSTDLTPQMARLKEAGAEKYLIGGGSSNAVAALKAMKVLGLDPKDAVIAFITASSDLITLADPELIENVYIQSTLWSGLAAPGGKQPQIMPLAAELWEIKHAGEPLHDVFLYGMITAMATEEAIGLALEEVSADELTSETLKEHGLNRVTDFTADGLLAEPGITWRAGVGNHDGPCSWFIWQFREGYNHLVYQQETCPYIKCTIK